MQFGGSDSLGRLVLIGLGLFDEYDMTRRGFEEIMNSDFIYAEFYTSLMAGLSLKDLEEKIGKKIYTVSRRVLEDENGEVILQKAKKYKVALLVPGDPLIATTHINLRIQAEKRGVKTEIVHGVSIISAAIGLSGLQNYRFGRSVTIPFPKNGFRSETPYNVIGANKSSKLHTLCFLDIDRERERYLTIKEALDSLLEIEKMKNSRIVTLSDLVIGVARAGSKEVKVRADSVENLISFNFGSPPHILTFPADTLHFMEAEALIHIASAPEWVKGMIG
jgi:diphthine synthase